MFARYENSRRSASGRPLPAYSSFPLKRLLCASVAAGFIAAAPAGHHAAAQVATPANEDAFATMDATARFLTQATFGPTPDEVIALTGSSPSQWLLAEFAKAPTLHMPVVTAYITHDDDEGCEPLEDDEAESGEDDVADDEDSDVAEDEECEAEDEELSFVQAISPNLTFWVNAITASDQLRQRMAFALSQIIVVSNGGGEFLTDTPPAMAYYQDILTTNAFGNYRDLLEEITYSPAMGHYLTYLANRKGDPITGRVPDENYARELMQLFTIGLVELNMDGTPKTGILGNAIETYDNSDITGLARVFTGLATDCDDFGRRTSCDEDESDADLDVEGEDEASEGPFEEEVYNLFSRPMTMFDSQHSTLEKTFLGTTIPANTSGTESISLALDAIFNHPNVAPFVSRQLIQRFVTSHPSPAYIQRVAEAFEAGSYILPDGSAVGEARRGDLQATIAAVLFDDDARGAASLVDDTFGKVREPVIRFTNWARAFGVTGITPEYVPLLWNTGAPSLLGQQPYGALSVFNFYRPGYVAPGTLTGEANLTVPELQIVNAATTPGYINFMTAFIFEGAQNQPEAEIERLIEEQFLVDDIEAAQNSFRPNYEFEVDLSVDAEALVDRVEAVLTYVTLSPESKSGIVSAVNAVPLDPNDGGVSAVRRVQLAILMVMTTPDYLVQR